MSHDSVNEMISILSLSILRILLAKIRDINGMAYFSVVCDEATDVTFSEQLNLSIRWVSDSYEVHEDPVGLFRLPNAMAETIYSVIKDLLIRCELPLQFCRGQTYDSAANMLGKRSRVAARMLDEHAAAIPVHCFGHCLNLILQDAGRKLVLIRDTLDLVKEICNLIRFSPKRLHFFSTNLQLSTDDTTTLKPLSTTRWTARTSATEAVLKDYSVWMSTLKYILPHVMSMV